MDPDNINLTLMFSLPLSHAKPASMLPKHASLTSKPRSFLHPNLGLCHVQTSLILKCKREPSSHPTHVERTKTKCGTQKEQLWDITKPGSGHKKGQVKDIRKITLPQSISPGRRLYHTPPSMKLSHLYYFPSMFLTLPHCFYHIPPIRPISPLMGNLFTSSFVTRSIVK